MAPPEACIGDFTRWLSSHGGSAGFHPDVRFAQEPSGGHAVQAARDLPADTTIVSMPFGLAITPDVARGALAALKTGPQSNGQVEDEDREDGASGSERTFRFLLERQLICSYVCLHWVLGLAHWEEEGWEHISTAPADSLKPFRHALYIDTLPPPASLRTPLHFTEEELEAFRGTNLHGAALDRRTTWEAEWRECRDLFGQHLLYGLASRFTWKMYLTAATYLSSRAFPSTLLSLAPSLVATPSSFPVLLPGIDALNHKRGQAVTWVVDGAGSSGPAIGLVVHTPTPAGAEIFNNYGAKPNAELILGYGFALDENPEDTIVLRIGGGPAGGGPAASRRWEVGRDAQGAEGVYAEVLSRVRSGTSPDEDPGEDGWDAELDAAEMLEDMVGAYLERLPQVGSAHGEAMRPDVQAMLTVYVEGQRAILVSILDFSEAKRQHAIGRARAAGVEIVQEGDDEELET